MNILGIDTSTASGGVALLAGNKVLSSQPLNLKMSHSTRLFPAILSVLDGAKLTIKNIDVIAITLGPGSFTGLRIGLMAAKTLCQLGNMKLVGLSTLEVLAYPLRSSNKFIFPIMDALRGDIYCAAYLSEKDSLTNVMENCVLPLHDFLKYINRIEKTGPYLFVGNGVEKYSTELLKQLGDKIEFPVSSFQNISPIIVAELGLEKMQQGLNLLDPLSVQPLYLRKPEAEVVWEKKFKH